MQFVFWQNIISPHQSSFLNALSRWSEVILVVEREMDVERSAQKWEIPSLPNIRIIVGPTAREVKQLLETYRQATHVFSGIAAYPLVTKAFRWAVREKLWVAVFAEPYNPRGWKGYLRRWKYHWLALRYGQKIQAIFATGQTGVDCFVKAGFSRENVCHWGYFPKMSSDVNLNIPLVQGVSILFVGQLIHRKSPLYFLDSLVPFMRGIGRVTLIGNGNLFQQVTEKLSRSPKINWIKGLSNQEVQGYMQTHDLLVLPSLFDGWGAVVNEALLNGMRVIASEECGASVLLDGKVRGEVFSFTYAPSLSEVLARWIEKGPISSAERKRIREWAHLHISGEVAARYFFDKINYLQNKHAEDVEAPWVNS